LNDSNISQQEHEFLVKLAQHYTNNQFNSLKKANNTLQEILDSVLSDKNNFLSQLDVLIEKFKTFLSTLNVEQLHALVNILALIIFLSCLFSVAAVLFSDYLIKYFNIVNKFPKISKYIELRRKFQ
jgi:hypothetical protein